MSRKTIQSCCVRSCFSNVASEGITLFSFPNDPDQCLDWLQKIDREDLYKYSSEKIHKNYRVCSLHFERGMVFGTRKNRLLKNAVPNLNKKIQGKSFSNAKTETDPLATSLSLLEGATNNIEYIVEDTDNGLIEENFQSISLIEDEEKEMETSMEVEEIKQEIINLSDDDEIYVIENLIEPKTEEITIDQPMLQGFSIEVPISLAPKNTLKTFKSVFGNKHVLDRTNVQGNKNVEIQNVCKDIKDTDTTNVKKGMTNIQTNIKIKNDIFDEQNWCYVPGCKTPVGKNINANLHKKPWFHVPSDPKVRRLWDSCINRPDRRLSERDFVCYKHFATGDIILKVDASTEGTTTKPKPELLPQAVPCVPYHKECCVPNCKTTEGKMYSFPIHIASNFNLWLYMIKNAKLKTLSMDELIKHRVCEKHFEKDCLVGTGVLNKSAAPMLHLPDVTVNHTEDQLDALKHTDGMNASNFHQYLKCEYKGCNVSSYSGKNFFLFPTDNDKCIDWLKASGRHDLVLGTTASTGIYVRSMRCGICENHFDKDDFATLTKLKPDATPIEFNLRNVDTENEPMPSNLKPQVCAYRKCQVYTPSLDVSFPFPSDIEQRKKWLLACDLDYIHPKVKWIALLKICKNHFTPLSFDSDGKLREDAIPINKIIRMQCAARCCPAFCFCRNIEELENTSHNSFPDPAKSSEKFDIWVKLLQNKMLENIPKEHIRAKYFVCNNHFEEFFYPECDKTLPLLEVAVPTLNLNGVIKWFFKSDYYNNKLKNKFGSLFKIGFTGEKTDTTSIPEVQTTLKEAVKQSTPNPVSAPRNDLLNYIEDQHRNASKERVKIKFDTTTCILEEDGINFTDLNKSIKVQEETESSTRSKKRKYPYSTYKVCRAGYGRLKNVEVGQVVKIHTAIVIDDDDECERKVLQHLLKKRLLRWEDHLN